MMVKVVIARSERDEAIQNLFRRIVSSIPSLGARWLAPYKHRLFLMTGLLRLARNDGRTGLRRFRSQ
jgi:hypothetical protein